MLIKNSDKAKQYSDTIKKYLELGHARKLNIAESLSHRYITNPNKQNKFKVVFDVSANFAGTSLNDY